MPAPSRMSWFVPVAARLCTPPGTAISGTLRSIASLTVISEPPCSRDSTTMTTSDERGDDAVAHREPVRLGRRAGRRLGQQQSLLGDRGPQRAVLARVDDVVAGGDDRDRTTGAGRSAARRGGRSRRCRGQDPRRRARRHRPTAGRASSPCRGRQPLRCGYRRWLRGARRADRDHPGRTRRAVAAGRSASRTG